MGMRRGAYESQTLGESTKSAKPASVQLNSIQTGMEAMAAGTKAYANAMGGLSKMFEFAGKVCEQYAEYSAKSRKEVAANDQQRDAAANKWRTIGEREGFDSERAKAEWNKVENLQNQRGIKSAMSSILHPLGWFGLGDPNSGYKEIQNPNGGAGTAQ